jgi:DNA (cytosine-5)-methyltransferase 1
MNTMSDLWGRNDMGTFTELSLFSGAGGGLLATKHLLGWRTVCYVEWDKYAIEVLKSRIRDGYLDDAPIWDDAFTFDGYPWAGLVDVVSAGFPCQPFSLAGKGLGEQDPRNGWPAVIRILREVRPRYALLENVPGLISKPYFRRILGDLAEAGFNIEQDCISAAEVGASHIRERLWIVAHAERTERRPSEPGRDVTDWHTAQREEATGGIGASSQDGGAPIMADSESAEWNRVWPVQDGPQNGPANSSEKLADGVGQGLAKRKCKSGDDEQEQQAVIGGSWWSVEPELGRVANGVASRVDRLRAIGNGQVPRVVAEAWERLGPSYE